MPALPAEVSKPQVSRVTMRGVRLRSIKLRLRPLNEAEAYARCHGTRGADVRIVHLEPKRPRYETPVSGEDLRRSFENKLDEREPHEQAGV